MEELKAQLDVLKQLQDEVGARPGQDQGNHREPIVVGLLKFVAEEVGFFKGEKRKLQEGIRSLSEEIHTRKELLGIAHIDENEVLAKQAASAVGSLTERFQEKEEVLSVLQKYIEERMARRERLWKDIRLLISDNAELTLSAEKSSLLGKNMLSLPYLRSLQDLLAELQRGARDLAKRKEMLIEEWKAIVVELGVPVIAIDEVDWLKDFHDLLGAETENRGETNTMGFQAPRGTIAELQKRNMLLLEIKERREQHVKQLQFILKQREQLLWTVLEIKPSERSFSIVAEDIKALQVRKKETERLLQSRGEEALYCLSHRCANLLVGIEDENCQVTPPERVTYQDLLDYQQRISMVEARLSFIKTITEKRKQRDVFLAKMLAFEKKASDPARLFQKPLRLLEEERFRITAGPALAKLEETLCSLLEEYSRIFSENYKKDGVCLLAILREERNTRKIIIKKHGELFVSSIKRKKT